MNPMDPTGKMDGHFHERRMWIWSLSTTWAWISLVRCLSNVPWMLEVLEALAANWIDPPKEKLTWPWKILILNRKYIFK